MGVSNHQESSHFDVVVADVQEVTLRGSAQLEYWRRALSSESLEPASVEGEAQVMVTAVQARFKRIRFRELSVSIAVGERNAAASGYFLAHAFNSVRFFAFVERARFHTPYYHAHIQVRDGVPCHVRLSKRQTLHLQAEMNSTKSREPLVQENVDLRWPIYLPTHPRRSNQRRLFHARLAGPTRVYAFDSRDTFTLQPSAEDPVFQQLIDSRFTPKEWHVRSEGIHGKSKTTTRS